MKLTQEQTDKTFMLITSNGCREMEETRFNQAVNEILEQNIAEFIVKDNMQITEKAMLNITKAVKDTLLNKFISDLDFRIGELVELRDADEYFLGKQNAYQEFKDYLTLLKHREVKIAINAKDKLEHGN